MKKKKIIFLSFEISLFEQNIYEIVRFPIAINRHVVPDTVWRTFLPLFYYYFFFSFSTLTLLLFCERRKNHGIYWHINGGYQTINNKFIHIPYATQVKCMRHFFFLKQINFVNIKLAIKFWLYFTWYDSVAPSGNIKSKCFYK